MNNRDKSLFDLKDPIKYVIPTKVDGEGLKVFASSNKKGKSIFQPYCDVRKLVNYVIEGREDDVFAILDQAKKDKAELKKLLTGYAYHIKNYAGQEIESATVLGAAFASVDDDMVAKLLPYFDELDQGRFIATALYEEQFPQGLPQLIEWNKLSRWQEQAPLQDEIQIISTEDGLAYRMFCDGTMIKDLIPWEVTELQFFPRDFKSINEVHQFLPNILICIERNGHTPSYDFSQVVTAITERNEIENALEQFRNSIKPDTVKTGCYFNHQILLDALKVFDANRERWSRHAKDCHTFVIKVFGSLQRHVSTCIAQGFSTGLVAIVNNNRQTERSLKIGDIENDDLVYFPLDKDPLRRLGSNFYINHISLNMGDSFNAEEMLPLLKSYLQQKWAHLAILKDHYLIPTEQLSNKK